jgi:hypothetical protein
MGQDDVEIEKLHDKPRRSFDIDAQMDMEEAFEIKVSTTTNARTGTIRS